MDEAAAVKGGGIAVQGGVVELKLGAIAVNAAARGG